MRTSVRDVSFLVAIVFTSGCAVLVLNACLSFVPFVSTTIKLPMSVIYLEGLLSVMSCGLFLIGSVIAYLEAVNANRGGFLGWRLKRNSYGESPESIAEKGTDTHVITDEQYPPSHIDQTNLVGRPRGSTMTGDVKFIVEETDEKNSTNDDYTTTEKEAWRWFPTAHELQTYRIFAIRFFANAIFLCSSIVYFSTSVASLISIFCTVQIAPWIRYPQLVAAVGFAVGSGLLVMINQTNWWRPSLGSLRWHINFLNLVGSAGFIFCAIFGLVQNVYWAQYQFGCSYLWGSWAFLIGSMVQWYESLDKHTAKRPKEVG